MTLLKLVVSVAIIIGCGAPRSRTSQKESPEPEKVTLCQLIKDRAAYNHKLIQVTGFVSHGFEDFTLFDPGCSSRLDVWLEYGGTAAAGTMYCCGVTPARSRPQELVVENIPIRLVEDARFREFDQLLQRRPDSVVHATIVGRFFSGEQIQFPNALRWSGYGHMGCCSLLGIEQVVSVDPHDRDDLDYGASVDHPELNGASCWSQDLYGDWSGTESLKFQERADEGDRAWSFDDPRRVAVGELSRVTKREEKSLTGMKETRREPGRIVYTWRSKGDSGRNSRGSSRFMVVVNRPYLLTYYAKDPKRIAWVVAATYEYGCR